MPSSTLGYDCTDRRGSRPNPPRDAPKARTNVVRAFGVHGSAKRADTGGGTLGHRPRRTLGGAVVTETVFSLPGLGKAGIDALDQQNPTGDHRDRAAGLGRHRRGQHRRGLHLCRPRPSGTTALTEGAQFGIDLGALLGGAVVTETVFSLPGLGKAGIDALNQQNQPVIIGIVLLASAAIVVANIAVDFVYAVLDPREIGRAHV